jgi:cyclohexanone monooxygenase
MFVVGPTQGASQISNVPHNLTEAGATIAAIVDHAHAVGADEVEVSAEVEAAWVDRLEAGAVARLTGIGDCTPGYYNNEGQSTGRRGVLNSMGYPEGAVAYFEYIDAWRSTGDFDGVDFR